MPPYFHKMYHILPIDRPKSGDASLRFDSSFARKKSFTAWTSAGGIFPPGFGLGFEPPISLLSTAIELFYYTLELPSVCGISKGLDTLNSLQNSFESRIQDTYLVTIKTRCSDENGVDLPSMVFPTLQYFFSEYQTL